MGVSTGSDRTAGLDFGEQREKGGGKRRRILYELGYERYPMITESCARIFDYCRSGETLPCLPLYASCAGHTPIYTQVYEALRASQTVLSGMMSLVVSISLILLLYVNHIG